MELVFQSSLAASYHKALEELVFFNPLQARTESAIVPVLDAFGLPTIVSDPSGLRLGITGRDDVQCLFALESRRGKLDLAGMLIYFRPNLEELVVLHIGVARRYGRSLRSSLPVSMGLLRTVRRVAHRLRGVKRLRMLYLKGRQFKIAVGPRPAVPEESAREPVSSPAPNQTYETVEAAVLSD